VFLQGDREASLLDAIGHRLPSSRGCAPAVGSGVAQRSLGHEGEPSPLGAANRPSAEQPARRTGRHVQKPVSNILVAGNTPSSIATHASSKAEQALYLSWHRGDRSSCLKDFGMPPKKTMPHGAISTQMATLTGARLIGLCTISYAASKGQTQAFRMHICHW